MTNEEIALKINNGESQYINTLYEQCSKFIDMCAGKYFRRNTELCINSGVELDDLKVCGFFALPDAVQGYCKSDKQFKFITYLKYPLLNVFNDTVGIRTQKGKKEVLNGYTSLYTTLDEDEETELIDTISDIEAEFEENIINDIALSTVFNEVKAVLNDDLKSDTLYQRYFLNKTIKEIAIQQNRSSTAVDTCIKKSFRKLKNNLSFTEFTEDILGSTYKKSGLGAFKRSGKSSVEWAVERLENFERR